MINRKKLLLLLSCFIFVSYVFSSARLIFRNDPQFYYTYLKTYSLVLPLRYSQDEDDSTKLYLKLPFGRSEKVAGNYELASGWYLPGTPTDSIFRRNYLELPGIFSLGFSTSYSNNFYASFNVDIPVGDTSFFRYGYENIFEMKDMTHIGLDFPKNSYLSYSTDTIDFSFGRNTISYGPLKYNLLLSDSAPYYDNLSMRVKSGNLNYSFSALSSIPMLSKQEYDQQFSFGNFYAYRNTFVNRLDLSFKNFDFSVSMLNHTGGRLADIRDMFLFSDNGLFSADSRYRGFFEIYTAYCFNYSNFKNSFAAGISKTIDAGDVLIRACGELYHVQDGIYDHEVPLKKLYYRTISVSNNPGSRNFPDTPFGFFYGENSNIFSAEAVIAWEDGYIEVVKDFGNNSYGKVEHFLARINAKMPFADLNILLYDTKNADKDYFGFSFFYILELGVII